MWTNVFKLGGLHQISWFQLLPNDFDSTAFSDKSVKVDQKDAATYVVLSAHLQLQKEGFLSTWTNSFVGPWDPSQGLHNPDEKIKLWLFLPGQHSTIVEKAHSTIARLRVIASGLWLAPGDSEEVSSALSQALRNCIERALRRLSYVRFGDVFSKHHPSSNNEELFRYAGNPAYPPLRLYNVSRKGQLVTEFIFTATEEAIFVHVIVSAKHVRALSGCDIEPLLNRSFARSSGKISAIVSPHGMRGKLTGCCPSDLVKQVYMRSGKSSGPNGIVGLHHNVGLGSGVSGQLRGQNSFVEVTLGCHDKTVVQEKVPFCDKMFIYPVEAVLVPVMQSSFARSSLKRFWLQNWVGPSLLGSSLLMHCFDADSEDAVDSKHGYHSSGNSNSSSNGSTCSSSSDVDRNSMGGGDLEADADSLMSRQSGLSSLGQMQDNGLKRPRNGTSESFGQDGMVLNPSMSDYGTMEANNVSVANELNGRWGWDDDDGGIGMDIQALLSEFGDFGDFFEDNDLPFGEPPGTAESQALVFPATDGGDLGSSPNNSLMDVSDQLFLPTNFSTFDSFTNLLPPVSMENISSKDQEITKISTSGQVNCTQPSYNSEFDHVVKAEALMSFAPQYGAVDTPKSEISSVIFRSPYIPASRKVDPASKPNNYLYSATPPSSPCCAESNEKSVMHISLKSSTEKNNFLKSKKYPSGKQQVDESYTSLSKVEDRVESSQFSLCNQSIIKPITDKVIEKWGETNSILSPRTVLSTDIECLMCQTSLCKLRHTLSPSSITNQNRFDSTSNAVEAISRKSELKKKETIPVRIAGDIDGASLDGPSSAPVGVWRSVSVPKGTKTGEVCPPIPIAHNMSIDESMLSYGLRQPLQELLDGIAILVQQATSFVDVALDADCGDGPYGWLALQEQLRRGFSCGPSMVHAGCGGVLASCHSLDIAGIELVDPLSDDVQASSILSLLQTDIKAALKSAFSSVDGPLSVTDWCRGRSPPNESGMIYDGFSAEDSSSTVTLSVGESMSPSLSSGPDQQQSSRSRSTLSVVPFPSLLVGYQDDWLKSSPSSLQIWEKAPLEPYATPKNMAYYVVCPNIDPLTTAASDFFLQLGTVYETCNLGVHAPQSNGNEMEIDPGKISPGFVLLDCPQSMKIDSKNASMLGSISDYFLCLSNGWDVTSFLKTLSKVLKSLKIGTSVNMNTKEGNTGPCTVVYVVCPFPEPQAILQTVVEASVAIGSVIRSSDKERKSMMHNLVAKALSYPAAADELFSNVLTLTGFGIPKLVLQIVTVDAIFRVTSPTLNELTVLKELAFTVYNKARRFSKGISSQNQVAPSLSVPGRSHSVMMQTQSPVPGMWKDPRLMGPNELDANLRPGTWDNNSWQTGRETNRSGDISPLDELCCLFEPLFILAEPGSLQKRVSPLLGNKTEDNANTSFMQSSASSIGGDTNGPVSQPDTLDSDGLGAGQQKAPPSLHCCYGWTEDWRWMVCVWTDSRGELLDSYVYPFGGVSSRQDTKGLQSLFVQILQQGCQILQAFCTDAGNVKPRDLVITRVGCFFELECQEWQKALYSAGGSEVKKWSLQLRRSFPDGVASSTSNGTSLQQTEVGGLMQDRNLPSSPNPVYASHSNKTFMKGGSMGGQSSSRKQLIGSGHTSVDNSKGLLQWVQSISFVSVSIDHSLQLVFQADSTSSGASQGSATSAQSTYLEGYSPVKSLGSASASYILIPSPSLRFLPPAVLQLPTCLTADSPPLAHLLHSKGSAIPLSTSFVVSKAVPSMRNSRTSTKEEWPSVLSVSLVDYYGGNNFSQTEKNAKGGNKPIGRGVGSDLKDLEVEMNIISENLAAEVHALSWMTVSPAYLDRRTALPFHCDMVLRLRRLLYFADKELSRLPEKARV